MATIRKPKGITITIRDRKENKSRTLTVYGTTLDLLYEKVKAALGEDEDIACDRKPVYLRS